MDQLTEDFSRAEDMRILTQEDLSEENTDPSDEVENLQNSFLEAVHDENIQPKMQCLMMDSSFSMVTMQGEGSGIEWETTPSRGTTPWPSETGNLSADTMGLASPGTNPAGKIIFVMDEELLSKQKKTKERGHGAKGKGDLNQQIFLGSFDNISGRPELVGFSEPNVKPELDEFEEQVVDLPEDKEQKLFRLVSEGSEILNIVVPTKVATIDEEESYEMIDNLSYLEASTVVKPHEEIHDITELQNEGLPLSEIALAVAEPKSVSSMDPPGAPVSKPSLKEQPCNVDYFEAFSLIDAQAPGGPTVSEQNKLKEALGTLEAEILTKATSDNTITLDNENAEKVSLTEMTSELLDDVFYGVSDNYTTTTSAVDNKSIPTRLSLKSTGATLFGSQEDVLTPIYLPEGPPKIIDPILLEEPKAMAFLYTDLYEEATGSRKKEEDTESISSEKSFHSRHSDREARGYLEKYVLIDETPVLEVEQKEKEPFPMESPRKIIQDFYEFGQMVSKPDIKPLPDSEEVTDFFRSSASSSPCALEPLSRSAEDDEGQTATTNGAKTKKKVLIVADKVPECTTEMLSEFPFDDCDWERTFDNPTVLHEEEDIVSQQSYIDVQLPVAPPKKKASLLDLEPLTPIILQDEMEAGAKEAREEEKEAADGGDVEESKSLLEASLSQETSPSDDAIDINDGLDETVIEATVSVSSGEGCSVFGEKNKTLELNVSEKVDQADSTNIDTSHEPAKDQGRCIIL